MKNFSDAKGKVDVSHTHEHAHMHTHAHTHTHTHMHTHVHAHMHKHTHLHAHTCTHAPHAHTHTHTHTHHSSMASLLNHLDRTHCWCRLLVTLLVSFSDTQRKLNKDDFIAPEGWTWEEDWFVNPEIRCVCMCTGVCGAVHTAVYAHLRRVPSS